MKILITGATGLVGKAIVKELHAKKITVNYLTTSKSKIVSKKGYQGYYWNPKESEIDINCFNDVEAIINLAGATISKRWTKSYKNEVLNSRIDSLKTLKQGLELSDTTKIETFASASAIGIYPNSLGTFYTEEETKVDNSFLGEVVNSWEDEIESFKEFGFKVSKIRIGLVLSKDGGALPKMAAPIKNYVGAAFGTGEQWQSWIHIDDLARLFTFVVSNKLSGIYNAVAPNPVTNSKMVTELAKVLGRSIILPNIPEFVMKLLLGEMAYLLFASQRVSSQRIEKDGFYFNYLNICKAFEAIYDKDSNKRSPVSDYKKEFA